MTLAIFDLDNTLIGGDSDHSWGEFLVEQSLVNADEFKKANDQFYEDYKNSRLDIYAYQEFALSYLVGRPRSELEALHAKFMAQKIEPILLPKAINIIAEHKRKAHTLLIITATNAFITQPIADRLGIENILATDPEIIDNQYTGKITGTPCFQDGKVARLNTWLESQPNTFNSIYFYSDSINDLPLLQEVDHPIAVDPDDKLHATANNNNWPIISLR